MIPVFFIFLYTPKESAVLFGFELIGFLPALCMVRFSFFFFRYAGVNLIYVPHTLYDQSFFFVDGYLEASGIPAVAGPQESSGIKTGR